MDSSNSTMARQRISLHNASSPLLRLPLEVKTKIYTHVLGGQIIHLHSSRNLSTIKAYQGRSEPTEDELQEIFLSSTDIWTADALRERHESSRDRVPAKLDLMFVCRQIAMEASLLVFRHNKFRFHRPEHFEFFYRSTEKCLAMRDIQINIQLSNPTSNTDWARTLYDIPWKFPNLENVHIDIEHQPYNQHLHPHQYVPPRHDHSRLMHGLRSLRSLPLKAATVIITDEHFLEGLDCRAEVRDHVERYYRWTLAQKQEWAKYVRDYILGREDRVSWAPPREDALALLNWA